VSQELASNKNTIGDLRIRCQHLEVELDTEKKIGANLAKSKKEISDSLNQYMVQCE